MKEIKKIGTWNVISLLIGFLFILGFISLGRFAKAAQYSQSYPWPYPPLAPGESEPEVFLFRCTRLTVYNFGPKHQNWYGWSRVRRWFDNKASTYDLAFEYYVDSSFYGTNIFNGNFAPISDGWYTWEAGSIMGHPIRGLPITRYIQCSRQFSPLVIKERSHEKHIKGDE